MAVFGCRVGQPAQGWLSLGSAELSGLCERSGFLPGQGIGNHMSENNVPMVERGTLGLGEAHPSAYQAAKALSGLLLDEEQIQAVTSIRLALANLAIEGNLLAEVCAETLRRYENHEPVSDRYLLGLAWLIFFESGGLPLKVNGPLRPNREKQVFKTYSALNKKKLIGQHWLWVAVERVAAGEDINEVMGDYGYVRSQD